MPGAKSQEQDVAAVVRKLLSLTAAQKLAWSVDERLLRGRENVLGHVYTAKFGGSTFAIHEFQYQHFYDEDQWDWVPSVRLELIDLDGRLLYEFRVDQDMGTARQLLEAVRRQAAGVDDLVKRLLATDDE